MVDEIKFNIINPIGRELWADDFCESEVVEIIINGNELIDILKKVEKPYAIEEKHPNLAGGYGHLTPKELYNNLGEAICNNRDSKDNCTELLRCGECGDIGCWSVLVYIEQDEEYVYWKKFEHNHREWKYPNSYKFSKEKYEKEINKLRNYYE